MPVLSTIGGMSARGFGWLGRLAQPTGLFAWGYNYYGTLGQGNTTNRSSPVQVGSVTTWTDASINMQLLAIQSNGSLWACGANDWGQLGDGTIVNKSSLVQIGALTNWAAVQARDTGSIALKTDGTLWTWGYNAYGQLGKGDTATRSSPAQVGALTSWTKLGYGTANQLNTHAIRTDGTLWAWGNGNPSGYDGYGSYYNTPYPTVNQTTYSSPVQVGAASNWSSVASGLGFALALNTSGQLYAWGQNTSYQCGIISTNNPEYYNVYPIYGECGGGGGAGWYTKYDSPLYEGEYPNVWNSNYSVCDVGVYGSTLTLNTYFPNTLLWGFSSPVQVGSASNWSQISAGYNHSGAINTSGQLFTWGSNSVGQCGNGSTTQVTTPQQVGSLSSWAFVKAGYSFSLAIRTNGTLWGWGWDIYGEVGQGNTTSYSSPVQIGSGTNWLKAIDSFDAGQYNSVAIRS